MRRTTVEDVMTFLDAQRFAVAVHDGVVTFTGRPETDQAGQELVQRVRHIEGVAAVRDHLSHAGKIS